MAAPGGSGRDGEQAAQGSQAKEKSAFPVHYKNSFL
jgi:hypothetical protein